MAHRSTRVAMTLFSLLSLCFYLASQQTAFGAFQDKSPGGKTKPTTAPDAQTPSNPNRRMTDPCNHIVSEAEQYRCRRLARQMAAEDWDYAIRAFPNGIPPGARMKAIEQSKKLEAGRTGPVIAGLISNAQFGSGASPAGIAGIEGDTWFPIGPAPMNGFFAGGVSGRASAVAVNPFNPDDIYLGAANGGVWHSTDGGLNWTPMSDQEMSLAIGAIVLDDCSASGCRSIYAGTGERSLRRDTYYGAGLLFFRNEGEFPAWGLLGADRFKFGSLNNVVLDPTSPAAMRRIYVAFTSGVTSSATQSTMTAPEPAAGYGIHLSEDGGLNWVKLTIPGTTGTKPTDLEMDSRDSNTLFAGFLGKGIFKGVRDPASGSINWCPLNPGVPVAGCPAVTCPGGVGTCLPDPTTEPFDFVELSIHRPSATNPAILYALFGKCTDPIRSPCNSPLFKSTDGGNTWTRVNSGLPAGYSRYTRVIAIHPTNPDIVFYGGIDLWKSTNGGQTFSRSDTLESGLSTGGFNNIHSDHHAVVFHPTDPMRMYNASDGGFATSFDGGGKWTPRNEDLQTVGFYSIASSIRPTVGKVIGGAQDNGISMWNGSRAWNFVFDGDGGATIMDVDNDLTLFGTRQDITPHRSVSGGGAGTWTSIANLVLNTSDKHAFYPPFIQDRFAAGHPLYIGSQSLYKSTNKGDSWVRVSPNAPPLGGTAFHPDINTENVITAIAAAPSNPNRVYIGYYDGQVFASKSGGPCDNAACWDAVGGAARGLPSAVVTRIAVDPANADTAYLTFSGFGVGSHIYKTTNGGGSWTAINSTGSGGTLPDIPANTISIEPGMTTNLWLGTDIGVFKSINGGASWMPFNKGLPRVAVYEISIDEIHGRVYAATHGRGAFVLTQPFLSNFEGWVGNQIWDIPVYGHAFLPNKSCKLQIVRQDGTICAEATKDAMGGDIQTNNTGQLVTSRGSFYSGQPVAWACFNGNCVNNTPIAACNSAANPVTSVLVNCEGLIGIDKILGCPAQVNPPDSLLGLSGLPGGPTPFAPEPFVLTAAAPDAGVVDVVASVQSRDGATRVLCSAPAPFQKTDTAEQVLARARDGLNASPACASRGLTARLARATPESDETDEDKFFDDPKLGLSAPTVIGGQLIPSFHVRPGSATGLCFKLTGLGVPVQNTLQVTRMKFETAAVGAAGGALTVVERSDLGTCSITVPISPGDSASKIATSVFNAFQTPGIPGPHPLCPSRRNPRDVMLDGDSIITVLPNEVSVCVNDAGVGLFVGPKELLMQIADLSITKSAAPVNVTTGSNITYTITVANRGADAATNVVVTDNLPATTAFASCAATSGGACGGAGNNRVIMFPTLAPNASATITLVATARCELANNTAVTNVVTVSADTFDSDASNNSSQTTVMAVNPPPAIVCPGDVTAMTARPGDTSVVVNYSPPAATDNCPGVTVVCSHPSGAVFPAGTTVVTCKATDAGGATAECSFKVTVFDVCLQDDQSRDVLLFNSFTGDYQFTRCGAGGFTITGRGMVNRTLCLTTLEDARVTATLDRCLIAPQNRGQARIKVNPVAPPFLINDTDTRNNSCGCQ